MKKLKHREVLPLFYALPSLGNLKGIKFLYAIDKNRKKLKEEVETIEERNKPSKDFEDYDKERVQLNEKYSAKNEDASPKMTQNQSMSRYIIDDKKKDEFDKEQEALKVKFKEAFEQREKQLTEYRKFLESENTSFSPYFINIDIVPEDITGDQFEIVSYFLESEKTEPVKDQIEEKDKK